MRQHRVDRIARETSLGSAVGSEVFHQKQVCQRDDIGLAFTQRRDTNGDFADPKKEVLTKPLLRDHGIQILVGRRHHSDIHRYFLAPTDSLDDLVLQEAQHFRL